MSFKDFLNKFFDDAGKKANWLHRNALFDVYFDIVRDLCDDYVDFRDGVNPLKIHNFISEYDTTLIVGLYQQSLLEDKKNGFKKKL